MKGRLKIYLAIAIVLLAHTSAAEGNVIYVDDDGGGANNGSSWANAYQFLQDALADANSTQKPVEIRVAQGTYKPDQRAGIKSGDPNAAFQLVDGVIVKGGYAGWGATDPDVRDIVRYEAILTGDLAGNDDLTVDPCMVVYHPSRADNSYHVVVATGCERTPVLDGFTIVGGNAHGPTEITKNGGGVYDGKATIVGCKIVHNAAAGGGGGIALCAYCGHEQGGLVKDCTISGNSAGHGGGISGCPEIVNCIIGDNVATDWGGGGINLGSSCETTITDCTFSNNRAADGGAVSLDASDSKAVFTRCTFRGNSASNNGGVIAVDGCTCGSEPVFYQCEFVGNSAGARGGVLYNYGFSNAQFQNCVLGGNAAGADGGAIYDGYYGGTRLVNCTVAGNIAGGRGGGICYTSSLSYAGRSLSHCIIWGNRAAGGEGGKEAQIYLDEALPPELSYCWIQGPIGAAEPLFADPNNGDFHLKSQAGRWDPNERRWTKDEVTSPCIDAGDPMSPIGYEPFPNGAVVNVGAYGGTAEASNSYFGQPVCRIVVAGDINGDCRVDFTDFAIMSLHWLGDNSP